MPVLRGDLNNTPTLEVALETLDHAKPASKRENEVRVSAVNRKAVGYSLFRLASRNGLLAHDSKLQVADYRTYCTVLVN